MTTMRSRKRCSECPDQCFCGSSIRLELNHIGGRKHVPDIYIPFCGEDHDQFHLLCRKAGVDFRAIKDRSMALIQAIKAMLIGLWMVVDRLEKHIKSQLEANRNAKTDNEVSKNE